MAGVGAPAGKGTSPMLAVVPDRAGREGGGSALIDEIVRDGVLAERPEPTAA
ncbi:MAG TPA: hypothetical protein VEV61_14550 [Streptosporangiaceae bacterium]|nr:hypothetical protein [Streptosporangiaceae bacterium]